MKEQDHLEYKLLFCGNPRVSLVWANTVCNAHYSSHFCFFLVTKKKYEVGNNFLSLVGKN